MLILSHGIRSHGQDGTRDGLAYLLFHEGFISCFGVLDGAVRCWNGDVLFLCGEWLTSVIILVSLWIASILIESASQLPSSIPLSPSHTHQPTTPP